MVNRDDVERQLIGSWISGYNQEDIQEFDHFEVYPTVFKALKGMDPSAISIVSVAKKSKMAVGEVAQIVADNFPSLYDEFIREQRQHKIKEMLQAMAGNPADLETQIQGIMKALDHMNSVKVQKPADLIKEYKEELDRRTNIEPLQYYLKDLDYVTGGVRPKELTVISARPSVGKTALSWQIAFKMALKKHKILYFPLEMSSAQLMERLVCMDTDIEHEKLKTPKKMDAKDHQRLNDFFENYSDMLPGHLNVIEGVNTISGIRHHIEAYKPECVFIDQLSQLRENRSFKDDRVQFTYMTNTLKQMTMEYNVPIILMAQISRDGEGSNPPTLSMLKSSGSIEEDADNVIMLHQPGETDKDATQVDIIVRKQRNGQRDVFIPTWYKNQHFLFIEESKRSDY